MYGAAHQITPMLYNVAGRRVQRNTSVQRAVPDDAADDDGAQLMQTVDYGAAETVDYRCDSLNRLAEEETTGTQWGNSCTFDGSGNLTATTVTKGTASSLSINVDGNPNRNRVQPGRRLHILKRVKMQAHEFSGWTQLRATPVILRMMTETLTPEEASWKPSAKRWSVLEVLGHLAHVEIHGFRGRVERILAEENPLLPSYDPNSFTYDVPGLAEGLGAFERERSPSLHLLETLPTSVLERSGVHSSLGPLTIRNLLNEWPLHDLGHIRQVAELIRAVRYYPHIGPWQNFYSLQP